MKQLQPDDVLETVGLSDRYAYLVRHDGGVSYTYDSSEAIEAVPPAERRLDLGSVVSLFTWRYILGDRTLVEGVERQPWCSRVTSQGTEFLGLDPFGERHEGLESAPEEFYRRLEDEIRGYLEGATRVVVLLSGGMDSRLVAGVVQKLRNEEFGQLPAQGFTWGLTDSRDVHYSRRIAEHFGWEWVHEPFDAADLRRNFEITVEELGGEVDPKHLHQLPLLANAEPGTVILAGSYGNSVGRAEYSSTKLDEIARIEPRDRHRFLFPPARGRAVREFWEEADAFRARYPNLDEQALSELERQAHYMRRMLAHPMSLASQGGTLHQAFTAPEIFRYVFSLPAEVRDDRFYRHLLSRLDPELDRIPWARTGQRFGRSGDPVDDLRKENHAYGRILRTELSGFVADNLFNGALESLKVFNMKQIEFMYREWSKEEPSHETELATHLSSLVCISMLTRRHQLLPPREFESADAMRDPLSWATRLSTMARRTSRPTRLRAKNLSKILRG